MKTVSTYPPEGLFTEDAETMRAQMASKKVSPKGPGSGMRMLTYFINRAGKGLESRAVGGTGEGKKLLSVAREGRMGEGQVERSLGSLGLAAIEAECGRDALPCACT